MTPRQDGATHLPLDLAAANERIDELGPAVPLPVAEVAELFTTLDKAVRSQRLYQRNNPVYLGFVAAAHAAFARPWDRVAFLTASVEESAFRWYGRAFTAGEGRDSLAYLFYKDGVRFITFLPGFEDELERFLDVVNRARQQDIQRTDDDMVTLLWQQQFTCFQYSYVDALAEGLQVPQSRVPQLAGVSLTLTPDDKAGKPRPAQPVSPAVQAGEPTVANLANRTDFEETLYFLEPGEMAKLRQEVEEEWRRDVKKDVLNALFDRLEQGLPLWRQEILRILRQMLPSFLGAGDLTSATTVIVELNALLEKGAVQGDDRAEAMQLFRELSEPAVLTQLMRSIEQGSIDPTGTELGIFLRHLGPAAMPVLLASIEQTVLPALQERLTRAMEELAAAHGEQLVALVRSTDSDVARGAARLVGQLGRTDGALALSELLNRADPTVRRAAAEALLRIRNSLAMEALSRALDDADREVRLSALRGITNARYAPARPRLEALLDSRLVREADLTEKIAFFEAYGAVATAPSVAMLDKMLNGRRVFGRESPELRACAAMALGRVGSPAARAALSRAADESNPMIRNAVQKALRQESA